MLKEMKYYCDGRPLTKDIAAEIAKTVFGEETVSIEPDLNSLNGNEIKGLEMKLTYSGKRTDLPSRIGLRKKSDGEPVYNPDYTVKIEGDLQVLDITDERIRKVLGM